MALTVKVDALCVGSFAHDRTRYFDLCGALAKDLFNLRVEESKSQHGRYDHHYDNSHNFGDLRFKPPCAECLPPCDRSEFLAVIRSRLIRVVHENLLTLHSSHALPMRSRHETHRSMSFGGADRECCKVNVSASTIPSGVRGEGHAAHRRGRADLAAAVANGGFTHGCPRFQRPCCRG